jgi:hypothetical protein
LPIRHTPWPAIHVLNHFSPQFAENPAATHFELVVRDWFNFLLGGYKINYTGK